MCYNFFKTLCFAVFFFASSAISAKSEVSLQFTTDRDSSTSLVSSYEGEPETPKDDISHSATKLQQSNNLSPSNHENDSAFSPAAKERASSDNNQSNTTVTDDLGSQDKQPFSQSEASTSSDNVSRNDIEAPEVTFPPLPQEKLEDKLERLRSTAADFKVQFLEYMNSTPERQEILKRLTEIKDSIVDYWEQFSQNPRLFLTNRGIDDERILTIAESFFIDEEFLTTSDLVSTKLLSCKTITNGLVFNNILVNIPKGYYLLDDSTSPLEIIFHDTRNMKSLSFNPTFPHIFVINGKSRLVYEETFNFPFSFEPVDTNALVSMNITLKGTICSNTECQPLNISTSGNFYVKSKLSSLECNYVKREYNRYHKADDFNISDVHLNKYFLKFSADIPYKSNTFRLILQDTNQEAPIVFDETDITFSEDRIIVIARISSSQSSPGYEDNLQDRSFLAKLGYNDYYTETTLNPTTDLTNVPSFIHLTPFKTGFFLILFSPILILLLFTLRKNQWKYAILTASEISLTILLFYPLLSYVCGSWGNQFFGNFSFYLGILLVLISTSALIKIPHLRLSGVIYGLLPIMLPCNYLADIFDYGDFGDFLLVSLSSFSVFLFIFALKNYLFSRLPQPLQIIRQSLSSFSVFMIMIFIPIIVFSFLILFLLFLNLHLIAFLAFSLLFIIGLRTLQTSLSFSSGNSFDSPILAFALAFIPLFFSITPSSSVDVLTEKVLQDSLKEDKIVYAMTDTKWCFTCQAGKILFLNSTLVSSLVKQGKLIVIPSNEDNVVMKDFSNSFGVPIRPLNILYSKHKPYGELLPSIVQNYQVKNYIHMVYPEKEEGIF